MAGVLLDDGTDLKVVTGIDDHSRFCVAAGTKAVCGVFVASLRSHGIPDEVLTDNGKVFTGRFGLHHTEVLFDRICRENGISHRLTPPRSPTTTGKIERFQPPLMRTKATPMNARSRSLTSRRSCRPASGRIFLTRFATQWVPTSLCRRIDSVLVPSENKS